MGIASELFTVAGYLVAFVVVIFPVICVHELGHYLAARWCGIGVEVFSIGFGPTLVSARDRRRTEWRISAIPLGGYVRFREDLAAADRSVALFEDAPVRHRIATVAGGPVANMILSIVVFAIIVLFEGLASGDPVVGKVKQLPPPGYSFLQGDRIMAINGEPMEDLYSIYLYSANAELSAETIYEVIRGEDTLYLPGPFPMPARVETVHLMSAASNAGLKAGDVILAVDGNPVGAFREVREFVAGSDGRPLQFELWRDGEIILASLAGREVDVPSADGGFSRQLLIGVGGSLFFEPLKETPGPIDALLFGTERTWRIIYGTVDGIVQMVIGQLDACNLRGPVGIARASGEAASQGVDNFILWIAFLSAIVGILNLLPLPFPVLDGGHLVYYAFEAATGIVPPERVKLLATKIGVVLVVALLALGLFNDFFCP